MIRGFLFFIVGMFVIIPTVAMALPVKYNTTGVLSLTNTDLTDITDYEINGHVVFKDDKWQESPYGGVKINVLEFELSIGSWTFHGDSGHIVTEDSAGDWVFELAGSGDFSKISIWSMCCNDLMLGPDLHPGGSFSDTFLAQPWYDDAMPYIGGLDAVSVFPLSANQDWLDAGSFMQLDKVAPIPEPATYFLMITGLLGVFGFGRNKNR